MNTLNFDLKSKTDNPFENLAKYPALLYKGESKVSVFSKSYKDSLLDDSEEKDYDLIEDTSMESHAENRAPLNFKDLSVSPAKSFGSLVKG